MRQTLICRLLLAAALLPGCATVKSSLKSNPDHLLRQACAAGEAIRSVEGSVWMKASSKEASGQFPAEVKVSREPRLLRMEVANLVGGREALITVEGERYSIDVPEKKARKAQKESGQGTWGGIPLRWAPDLFLGQVPCPSTAQLQGASRTVDGEGNLRVETRPSTEGAAEVFEYRFRDFAGDRWPASLVWERTGPFVKRVEFKFDDLEDYTHSPRRWEAKSPEGEVKVRWKERQVVR